MALRQKPHGEEAKPSLAMGISGEFLWYGSAEAAEYRQRHGASAETVCWSQVCYASGYATRCLGRLIVYKELECLPVVATIFGAAYVRHILNAPPEPRRTVGVG